MNTIFKESDPWIFFMVKKTPQTLNYWETLKIQWEMFMLNANLCILLCMVHEPINNTPL